MIEFIIASVFIAILILVLMYRFIKGPTDCDRIATFAEAIILGSLILIFLGVSFNRAIYVNTALVIGIFGFCGILIVAKYVGGKSQ